MGKPHRLKEVEEEAGVSLKQLIPALLNELGSQKEVAARLGVKPSNHQHMGGRKRISRTHHLGKGRNR